MIALLKGKTTRHCILFLTLASICIPLASIASRKVSSLYTNLIITFFTPQTITVTTQEIHNKLLENSIKGHIYNNLLKSVVKNDVEFFFNDLKKKFPIIDSIICNFSITRSLDISILGKKPYCLINNSHILTDHNNILPISMFRDIDTGSIYHITINPSLYKKATLKKIFSIIQKITADQWRLFAITIHGFNNIELIPYKSICKCKVIANAQSLCDQEKIDAINNSFEDLFQKGFITKQTVKYSGISLAFDTRFKNQIVVKFYKTWRRGAAS